jgi:hypothetical protein
MAALANGRYPMAGQIAVDSSDPTHMLVRATYGFVTTSDGGKSWSWICEGAVGYSGYEDPMVSITKDGTVLAGLFQGLSVTRDRGCQWDLSGAPLAQRYVTDLATERSDPASVVVLVSNSTGKDAFLTQIWQSPDNALTFTQAGVDLPTGFLGLTVDTAPSDSSWIYVSGRYGSPDYPGVLERSQDRGKMWEMLPIPGSNDLHLPYIGAIDPKDPAIVYVRLNGDTEDPLLVSKDGGGSWKEVFSAKSLLGFALSPDGATIAVGSDKDGLWTAPTDTFAFTKVSNVGVRCLTWTSQGLFACADDAVDGFSVGRSTDGGRTFSPLLRRTALCDQLTCDPASSTGKVCPMVWGATKLMIGAVDCAADAGAASSGSAGGSGTGGCSCSAVGEATFGLGESVLGLFVAVRLGRRLKRR